MLSLCSRGLRVKMRQSLTYSHISEVHKVVLPLPPGLSAWVRTASCTFRSCVLACTQANAHLKASAFRVERTFLIGLRAQKPETRQKFFALYNELVPKTIFDRLKYIFMDQDWERLSHTFWLKQAQVHAGCWCQFA